METAVRSTGLLRRTIEFFFPPAVSTLQDLHDFITGEASYLAQKTVVGYCRVKTMLDFDKLLTEPAFREGYDITRWEGYAGTLGDSLILLEGLLRPADEPRRTRLADSVAAFYPLWLGEHLPSHRQNWDDWHAAFAARFALSRLAEPVRPDIVIRDTAKLIHETVPIADRLKRNDHEVILGDLRLHAVAMHTQMLKRFRREALVQALTAD